MADKRTNIIVVIAGTRNTGKTTFLKGNEQLKVNGIIDNYLDRDSKQKILVVDLFDNPVWKDISIIDEEKIKRWKSGVYRIFSNDISKMFSLINRYCYNTILIFEDATKYIKPNFEDSLNQILIDSKQKNNDVYFVFHYLMAVPPDLVRISDYLVLFKTNETFTNQYKNKFPHPDIMQAFREVSTHKDFHYCKTVALI